MFIDGRGMVEPVTREHDLCIVGAGAAGIAVAREFLGTGRDVCLLESGGFDLEKETQELYRGELDGTDVDPDYLTRTRLRVFGGSMMAWGGMCRPMDEIDFEAKPWLPHYPAWPFDRRRLVPYYDRASKFLEIESFFAQRPDQVPFFSREVDLVALPFQFSPTYPGQTYRGDFEDAGNVTVYLHVTAKELTPSAGGNRIERLHAVAGNRVELTLKARTYVLCAGGLETPRILLNSDRLARGGIGNGSDLVGRYFMSHFPLAGFGRIMFVGQGGDLDRIVSPFFSPFLHYLALGEPLRRKEKLLSAGFQVNRFLAPQFPGRYPRGMEKVLPAFESLLRGEVRFLEIPILAVPEQAPNPESRVVLANERDPIGMRMLKLRFRRSSADRESLRRSVELLGRELGRHSLGRVQTAFDGDSEPALRPDDHHMGTTRMHQDPRQGVVDEESRVHGVDNLFIAGPSVFPSGGFVNPVLTIIALAIRLADHLKETTR